MLPTWLTEEYIETHLRAYCKDGQLRVLKLWAKPATEKGGNYVGVMTRIYVDYEDGNGTVQNKSFILKQTCSKDATQWAIFQEYDVYNREMDMYEVVMPKMAELLREIGVTEKLTAEAIVVDRERTIMILEDLATLRYVNADRVKQLDMTHTKMTIDMLARFHAAAIVLNQRYPEILAKNYSSHFFSRNKNGYKEIFTGLFRAFTRYVNTTPSLKNRYSAKLEHIASNLMEYAARSVDVGEKDFQTLVHGDCWTTNVMYQYDDEGNPTSILPIDFQFSSLTSPVVDLHYLFSTSLQENVREKEIELVQYHYYALKQYLDKFSYKGVFPSLHEYQLQFERRRFMTVIIANVFQPIMVYEGTEDPEFVNLYQDTPEGIRFQDSMYACEKVQRIVANILPIMDAKGLLDPQ
ncbi:uncharacterized protein [Drosophila pseudoobscura]|uniref:CHK kinase-like domain-containing protein n=1 Tax=Drosophila pseudoobscura pseudoobscura TaxID=46245 RepID=A0A6I8V2Q2_DROPS|nr:uncharacterized protein LOC6897380 [Drosophila pseudoobscura]